MAGYLEQLPLGKKKETLLKTWKRRYCIAKKGTLYFYMVSKAYRGTVAEWLKRSSPVLKVWGSKHRACAHDFS